MSASENEFLARNSSIVQALRTYLVAQAGGVERLLPKEEHSINVSVQPLGSGVIEEKKKNSPHTNNNEVRLQLQEILKEERKFLGFLEDLHALLNNRKIKSLFSEDALNFINKLCQDIDNLIKTQREYVETLNACVKNGFNREQWIERINSRNNDTNFRSQVIDFSINLVFLEKLFAKVNREQLEIAIDKIGLDEISLYYAFKCGPLRKYFEARVNIRQSEDSLNLLESQLLDLNNAEQSKNEGAKSEKKEIEGKKRKYEQDLKTAKNILSENEAEAIKKLQELGIYFGEDSVSMERSYLAFEKKRDFSQGTPALILKEGLSQTGVGYVTRRELIIKNCKDLFLGDSDMDKDAQKNLIIIFNNLNGDSSEFNAFLKKHEVLERLELKFKKQYEDVFADMLLDEKFVRIMEAHLRKRNQDPRKHIFNIKLLALVWWAIKNGVFSDQSEKKNFLDLLVIQAAKFSLRRGLYDLLDKADEHKDVIEKALNKKSTRDIAEAILPLVRDALIQLEPDMAEFFRSKEFEAFASGVRDISEHFREKKSPSPSVSPVSAAVSPTRVKSRRDDPNDIAPSRPVSVSMPVQEVDLSRNSSGKELTRPVRSVSVFVPTTESRRGSSEGMSSSSSESVAFSESSSSSSSGPEVEFSLESPRNDSEDRNLRDAAAKTRHSSPSSSHASFFGKAPEKRDKFFDNLEDNDIAQRRVELSNRLAKKGTRATKEDIEFMQKFSAAGSAAALFALAQAAHKGEVYNSQGMYTKDPVAAFYLALLALEITQNKDSKKKIIEFMKKQKLSAPDKGTECCSNLKIRIGDEDYSPDKLHEAYNEHKIQRSVAANGYSR